MKEVVVVKPMEYPEVKSVSDISTSFPDKTARIREYLEDTVILAEEQKEGMPLNRAVYETDGSQIRQIIAGDFVICGTETQTVWDIFLYGFLFSTKRKNLRGRLSLFYQTVELDVTLITFLPNGRVLAIRFYRSVEEKMSTPLYNITIDRKQRKRQHIHMRRT